MCEISLPQLAPMEVTLIEFCGTPDALLRAASTFCCTAGLSVRVCTCHSGGFPIGVTFWTMASLPPPDELTAWRTWVIEVDPASNW